ncbi:MAG: PAS domain-containing sensor histidine kinase [Desulfobacterales bacterium]|nr:PAS domain-containing sensor histidine kinase [Desulfobacterales bacterium]
MKSKTLGIAFIILILLGLAVFLQLLIQTEKKAAINDLYDKGDHIVGLLSLHSIKDFGETKRDLLIKTLMQSNIDQKIVYCFIHDQNGKPLVSLALNQIASEIPYNIQENSLTAMGLVHQYFKPIESKTNIYEFSKPIFEKGEKTGTVRVGFKPPPISILSTERITLIGVIAFFIIAAIILSYYGFVRAFKPLENFIANLLNTPTNTTHKNSSRIFGIEPMMQECKNSIMELKDRLNDVETKNNDLSCKLGISSFEKNQSSHILNSINLGIIVTDIHENVGFINDHMLSLLKKKRNDIIDSPLAQVIKDNNFLALISRQQGFESPAGSHHFDITFPNLAPDKTYQISHTYLTDDSRALIGKLIIFNNTTREKEAAQAINDFTAHVTHELMTPLTTIKSYSEMLMDGEITDAATQKEFYNIINAETDRLSRLIKDLLNISQIEMGSLTLNSSRVKSDWLFEDCIETVTGAARKKNISILKRLPDNFPTLMGDKELLKGAIINILGNAIKYTPENGQVEFELSEDDHMVIFDISDSGYGISTEELPLIFDKFYRSANPQIVSQQGTGLGLAITSQIISLHGGEIKVESKTDKGTHFTVKIPKKEDYLGEK